MSLESDVKEQLRAVLTLQEEAQLAAESARSADTRYRNAVAELVYTALQQRRGDQTPGEVTVLIDDRAFVIGRNQQREYLREKV